MVKTSAVTLCEERGGAARLRPWALLDQQELAAGVVDAGLVEVDHDLQREHHVAVQVAVQRVPVAGPVAQQDRRGPRLPGGVAPSSHSSSVSGHGAALAAAASHQSRAIGSRCG